MRIPALIALTLLVTPVVIGGITGIAYGIYWSGAELAETFGFIRDESEGFALVCAFLCFSGVVYLVLDDFL